MKEEELREVFESYNNDDFVSSFDFDNNRAWVTSPKGLLDDEELEIMEDGSVEVRMTGDTREYNSLGEAIGRLFEWWSEDIVDYIVDEHSDLKVVETTSESNGYPRNIMKAVVGLPYCYLYDIYEKYKGRLEFVSLMKRNGWDLWYREGWVCGDYELDEEDSEENGGVTTTHHYRFDSKERIIGLIEIR